MKDVHNWFQPLRIAALRLIELLDLLLKHGEDASRRIAGLEPASEWVLKKIPLCALFVRFQCIIENWLEVGGCRSRVRHKGGSEGLRDVGKEKGGTPRMCGHSNLIFCQQMPISATISGDIKRALARHAGKIMITVN